MNPMLSAWLGALLRAVLGPALTWIALRIGMDEGDATVAALALSGVILNVVWVLWTKYRDRLRFLSALEAQPYMSEQMVKTSAKFNPPNVWETR